MNIENYIMDNGCFPYGYPSSENIKYLNPDEVFVFGSNLDGRHGKGAAKQALCLFKNFPQFVVIHTVKCFGIVNKAK